MSDRQRSRHIQKNGISENHRVDNTSTEPENQAEEREAVEEESEAVEDAANLFMDAAADDNDEMISLPSSADEYKNADDSSARDDDTSVDEGGTNT